jgi:hypothetical protein
MLGLRIVWVSPISLSRLHECNRSLSLSVLLPTTEEDNALQGEMINESGTMTGGGGKPRGGRICLGNAPPKAVDTKTAEAELAQAETELKTSAQVLNMLPCNLH